MSQTIYNRPDIDPFSTPHVRCSQCNYEISSPNQVKIEQKMVSNVKVFVYTCYSCLRQMSRSILQTRYGDNREPTIIRRPANPPPASLPVDLVALRVESIEKIAELEKKETEFRQKITKHSETLVRLKAENDSLLDEINRMRTERNKQRALLSTITVELDTIGKSIEESIDKKDEKRNICSICMDRERNQAIVDCGHTACQECYSRINDNCPVCGIVITRKIKIYLS
jgi:regulator of replication initiation timing